MPSLDSAVFAVRARDGWNLPETPAATDGETATETDELVTEASSGTSHDTEPELELVSDAKASTSSKINGYTSGNAYANITNGNVTTRAALSQHDLMNMYFRKDAILFHNIDLLRYAHPTAFLSLC